MRKTDRAERGGWREGRGQLTEGLAMDCILHMKGSPVGFFVFVFVFDVSLI